MTTSLSVCLLARDATLIIRQIYLNGEGMDSVCPSNSVSCVRASQSENAWVTIESGVRQGCALARDLFATGVDWRMEPTVGTAMNGVSFVPHSFSDLDFADEAWVHGDNVCLCDLTF